MMDSLEYSVWNEVEINKEVDRTVENEVWKEWLAQYKKFVRDIVRKYSFMLEEDQGKKRVRKTQRTIRRRQMLRRTAGAATPRQSGKLRPT